MGIRITRWLIFSVLVSLLPVIFSALVLLTGQGISSITVLLSGGELLLISSAICAGAIGEIVTSTNRNKIGRVLAGGGSVIILASSSFWFAHIVSSESVNGDVVAWGSIYIFGLTVLTGMSCISLSE